MVELLLQSAFREYRHRFNPRIKAFMCLILREPALIQPLSLWALECYFSRLRPLLQSRVVSRYFSTWSV